MDSHMAGPINSKLSEHVVGYLEIVLSQKKIFVDFDIGSVSMGSTPDLCACAVSLAFGGMSRSSWHFYLIEFEKLQDTVSKEEDNIPNHLEDANFPALIRLRERDVKRACPNGTEYCICANNPKVI